MSIKTKGATKSSLKKKKVSSAILKINACKNNVFFTLTTATGDVLCNVTCGTCGYKHSKKNTPSSIRAVFESIKEKMSELGLQNHQYYIEIKGYGQAINEVMILLNGLNVLPSSVAFVQNLPHGGTKPKKPRSV